MTATGRRRPGSVGTSHPGGAEAPGRAVGSSWLVTAAVVAALVALVALGRGDLAAPTDWSPDGLARWAGHRDSVVVAMAVLRLGALGAAAQVLVVGMLGACGTALHLPAVVHAADVVALPGLRGLVRRIAGVGLSASTLLAPSATNTVSPPAPVVATRLASPTPVVAVRLADRPPGDDGAPSPPTPSTAAMVRTDADTGHDADRAGSAGDAGRSDAASTGEGQATMEVVEAEPGPPGPPPSDPAPVPAQDPAGVITDAAPAATWTVQRGDHLWSITESTLERTWARTPTEAEVDRYWRAVVGANAELADPDLIFPGQVIDLPPVPLG